MLRLTNCITLIGILITASFIEAHGQSLPVKRLKPHQELPSAKIVIIIDDLGHRWDQARRVLNLPGDIAYAILPHTPYSKRLARAAHAIGRDVMIHMPMEPVGQYRDHEGMLTLPMSHREFLNTLRRNLEAVPYAIGINNHMGSLLTQAPGQMSWVMEELQRLGNLFFVDSRTTPHSVAHRQAREYHIPTLGRDIFLDHDPDPAMINLRFDELIAKAHRRGWAVAIGHPYPETLTLLEARLPQLSELGVELVSPSHAIALRDSPQRLAGAGTAPVRDDMAGHRAPLVAHRADIPAPSGP